MASGSVHITWYATGLRADRLAKALAEISELSPRYGATGYQLYRSRDDRYKFLQILNFDSKLDFERYWDGPEVTDFRVVCSGWYQVPLTYIWQDLVVYDQLPSAEPVPLVGPPHESELA